LLSGAGNGGDFDPLRQVRNLQQRQGSQFTSWEFTKVPSDVGLQICMDGKRAWRHNFVVERFWRTIKYQEDCICAYTTVPEARAAVGC
jgi:putative transposase